MASTPGIGQLQTPPTSLGKAAPPSPAEVRTLASQFESMFLSQMLKEMRGSMFGDEEEDKESGFGGSPLTDAVYSQLSVALGQAGGIGLAQSVMGSLMEQSGAETSGSVGAAGLSMGVDPLSAVTAASAGANGGSIGSMGAISAGGLTGNAGLNATPAMMAAVRSSGFAGLDGMTGAPDGTGFTGTPGMIDVSQLQAIAAMAGITSVIGSTGAATPITASAGAAAAPVTIDPSATPAADATVAMPGRMSSSYGWRRDPIDGSTKFHKGVDLALPTGSEVPAAKAGQVAFAGELPGYGLTVEISHGDGVSTRYGHLSELDVKQGDAVAAGQTIAKSGSTGRSTGPHLHFEVLDDGQAVDPSTGWTLLQGQQ